MIINFQVCHRNLDGKKRDCEIKWTKIVPNSCYYFKNAQYYLLIIFVSLILELEFLIFY